MKKHAISNEEKLKYIRALRTYDMNEASNLHKNKKDKLAFEKVRDIIFFQNNIEEKKAQPSEYSRKTIETTSKLTWKNLSHYIYKLYKSESSLENAILSLELALIYANAEEIKTFIKYLRLEHKFNLYNEINPELRIAKLAQIWKEYKSHLLFNWLLQNINATKLHESEYLYIFALLVSQKRTMELLKLYKAKASIILKASEKYSKILNLSPSEIRIKIAEIALENEQRNLCLFELSSIPRNDLNFKKANKLLLDLYSKNEDPSKSDRLFLDICEAPTWKQKKLLFEKLLSDIHNKEIRFSKLHINLNFILKNHHEWLPNTYNAWEYFSSALIKYQYFDTFLPNFWDFHAIQALKQNSYEFEIYLWVPFLNRNKNSEINTNLDYFTAISKVHLFLASKGRKEAELFQAKNSLLAWENQQHSSNQKLKPNFISWNKIRFWAAKTCTKNLDLSISEKKEILAKLNIACHEKDYLAQNIYDYLEIKPFALGLGELQRIKKYAKKNHLNKLMLNLYLKENELFNNICNNDLKFILSTSAKMQTFDLSWRVCTILEGRQNLDPMIKREWIKSGEAKDRYQYCRPTTEEVNDAILSNNNFEKEMALSLMVLGPNLNKLINSKRIIEQSKICSLQKSTLKHMRYISLFNNKYLSSCDFTTRQHSSPLSFILLNSPWCSLQANIYTYMGLDIIQKNYKALSNHLDELKSMLNKESKINLKLSSNNRLKAWKDTLTNEEKRSLYKLISIRNKFKEIDLSKLLDDMLEFSCKVALLIYPAHHEALSALRRMRVSTCIIWNLEKWIISLEYSRYREKKEIEHRAKVPVSLF